MRIALVLWMLVNPIVELDTSAQQWIQQHRRPTLEGPMRTASNVGKPGLVFGVLLAVALLDQTSGVTTARAAVLVLAPVNLVVELIKRGVNRTRPDGEHKRSNASFPSSHAANAFALAAVLAQRWRRAGPLFWVLASTVAFSRVYLNRHYLSDVLAGALIGIILAWVVMRWISSRSSRRKARSSTG